MLAYCVHVPGIYMYHHITYENDACTHSLLPDHSTLLPGVSLKEKSLSPNFSQVS